jgi:hypothetical protein
MTRKGPVMASKIVGRKACPLCDFDAAHVKQSERCAFLYCPECGCQLHTKNARQAELLRRGMRPEAGAAAAPAAPVKAAAVAPVAAPAAPPPAPTAPPKPAARGGLLGLWAGG